MVRGRAAGSAALFLLFACLGAAGAQQAGIGAAINRTAGILSAANQSAYLIFYPNLTGAYSDYYRAVNISGNASNYSAAYSLLNRSAALAEAEEAGIGSYSGYSAAVLAALGAITAAVLYRFMGRTGRR